MPTGSEINRRATPTGPRPIVNQTRREAVVAELRRAILTGELKAGERVREIKVAQQLGISRPTLREAVFQLIHEGLLIQEPYRGVLVASIDRKFVSDIADVRVALETLAAKAIAGDSDGARRAQLQRAWDDYQYAHDRGNQALLHQAHTELHRTIWMASDNSLLQRLWPTMEAHFDLAMELDESMREDPERALHLHRGIVEAILDGSAERIETEVERHTRHSADELVEMMDARTSTGPA